MAEEGEGNRKRGRTDGKDEEVAQAAKEDTVDAVVARLLCDDVVRPLMNCAPTMVACARLCPDVGDDSW
jgi:hypothetical protein